MTDQSRRNFLNVTSASAATLTLAAGLGAVSAAQAVAPTKKKKILMPIGDATETMDTLYPLFRIPEEGYELVVCGPEARLYHSVLHEIPPDSTIAWDITQERPGYFVRATAAFRDIDPTEFCSVFLSGGRAPEYLRYNKDLIRLLKHFHEAQKPVASVCHGVELLTAANMVRGKKATTVPKCALDIEQGGGTYVTDLCIRDGNLVSCKGWAEYPLLFPVYFKMIEEMG